MADVRTDDNAEMPDEVDPAVAEHVVVIRDRFGLRGLRSARWMIDKEIALAEAAMADLSADSPSRPDSAR